MGDMLCKVANLVLQEAKREGESGHFMCLLGGKLISFLTCVKKCEYVNCNDQCKAVWWGGPVLRERKRCFGSLTIWLYRFIIEEKDTFFSTAQRSLLVYQILLRCVFEDHAEKSKCKFGECSGLFSKWFYWLTLLLNHAAY